MAALVAMALLAGVLVSVSRALNGRLAQAGSPLRASLWNHVVGLGLLLLLALGLGQLWPAGMAAVPWWAWFGGPLGVVFIALGAWLVARIGAAMTALMVIAGQMVAGAALDLAQGAPVGAMTLAGVALVLAGMALVRRG